MQKKLKFTLFCLFTLGGVSLANAQITLQVVTKNIQKTIEYKKGYTLYIAGEKASIEVDTWEKDQISVQIELSAKHPELAIAENDLKYFKYVSERIGKKIYLRNYIAIPKGKDKPTSKYKANFKVIVPKKCEIELSNQFGKAEINDLLGDIKIESHFCHTTLNNLQGIISINTKYGNINAMQISGEVKINATRSDITLSQVQGSYSIKSQYGVVRINADEDLLNLNIDAKKTDIHFYNKELGRYQYALMAEHGEIKIADGMKLEFSEITEHTKSACSPKDNEVNVSINTSYGDIIIQKTEN